MTATNTAQLSGVRQKRSNAEVSLFVQFLTLLVFSFAPSSFSAVKADPPDSNKHVSRGQDRPTRFNISISGSSGLVRAVSPYTLRPGEVGLGFAQMNFDRDPGDTDFVEDSVQGAVGLPARMEVFVRTPSLLRTNSVNLDPLAFPVPPFDLVLDIFPTPALRSQPYFLFTQEAPYKTYFVPGVVIAPPGDGGFASSWGDWVLGVKKNILSEGGRNWFGFGIQGYVELPTEEPGFRRWSRLPFVPGLLEREFVNWREKAGVSGERDFGLDLLFSKQVRRGEVLLNLGYKRIGDPDQGFRLHFINSGASRPEDFVVSDPIEFKLDLKDEARITAGATFPVFSVWSHQVWFVGEFFHKRFVGSGTRVQKLVHPVETTWGLQFNPSRWLSFGVSWLIVWNSAGHGGQRFSPFAGDINFGELAGDPLFAGEVKAFLVSRGVPLFENTNGVFATENPIFDAWRNIPSGPGPIVSRGHSGAAVFITIRP